MIPVLPLPRRARTRAPAAGTAVMLAAATLYQQAQVVADFFDQIESIDPETRVVVPGDLTDFEFTTVIGKLSGAGLTDLPATFTDAERYGYIFGGNSQVLEHIVISPSPTSAGYAYDSDRPRHSRIRLPAH